MKKKTFVGALSLACAFCCTLGAISLLPEKTVTAETAEATTIAYEDLSFVCKNSSTKIDDTVSAGGYFRDDLSDYKNSSGAERLNTLGRYFDANNFGIWEIPLMTEYDFTSVTIGLRIKTVWIASAYCSGEQLTSLDGVTFTEIGSYTDDSNRLSDIKEYSYDVTSLVQENSKYIYLKVSDPSTSGGNGPQVAGASIYYNVPVAHTHEHIVSDGTDENVLTSYSDWDGTSVIEKGGATNTDYVYFDKYNNGVWSFPIPTGAIAQGSVVTKIYKDWTISIAFGAANASLSDLTFTTLNQQTEKLGSATAFEWTFAMPTESAQNVYVRVQDYTPSEGNGPRVSYMGVRFAYLDAPEIVADETGNVPVGSTLSLYDAIGLQYAIGDEVDVEDITCEVADGTVLSYADGSLTGLKNGSTQVTVKVGDHEVTRVVTVDGFTETYTFTTNALNNSHYRSDSEDLNLGGAYSSGNFLYFDKTNVGVWEIPVATDPFKSAALTANLNKVWQLEVAVGESNVDANGYAALEFHEISSNVVTAISSFTDYTFDLDEYITERGVAQSLYVRISDPTEGNGNGAQIYRLTVTYNYDKNRVTYAGGNVANDYVAHGETVTLPAAVDQTGEFLGWSLGEALYLDGAEVTVTEKQTTFTAETIDFSMTNGASIRLNDTAASSGIRFESKFLTADYNSAWIVEYGTLILPTDSVKGENAKEFVIENFVVNETVLKVTSTVSEADGDYTVFRGGIIRILEGNYAREFAARGYMLVKDALGNEKYIYTDFDDVNWEHSRSVAQVATNLKTEDPDTYNALSDKKKAVVDAYIAAGVTNEEE